MNGKQTFEVYQLIPRSDIAVLLSELSKREFTPHWAKNTNLSISGHISDAALWVTQIPSLNAPPIKQLAAKRSFIPIERLLSYCQSLINEKQRVEDSPSSKIYSCNVINFSDYKKG
ncbi:MULTISPECIES: hypothetical protein [unclassified Pseudoalteromonas]|uniref:hypothetical protein n=1 Tax=unclassified Pseudoalteromonas TaxID=194690 RepID=UPI002175A1AF|nr:MULTISPECIES: hypothetical protein [unclassified Pseudoalteromonas]